MKRTSAGAKTATKQVLKRVLGCIGPYWIFLALSLALAAASVGTQLLVPILTGEAIDVMLGAGRVDFAAGPNRGGHRHFHCGHRPVPVGNERVQQPHHLLRQPGPPQRWPCQQDPGAAPLRYLDSPSHRRHWSAG